MDGQRVGYTRVSSRDQNPDRQLDGVPVDRMFTDSASGHSTARPQLEALLAFVRDGDTILVHSMDRLARNLDDLRTLVRTLTDRGVRVHFITEKLTFGEDTATVTLLLSVMEAVAEFERSLSGEPEGIVVGRQRAAHHGRTPALNPEQAAQLRQQAADGTPKAQLAREYGVSRETVYQYMRAGRGAEPAG